jgi:serine/threonine-protein kinase
MAIKAGELFNFSDASYPNTVAAAYAEAGDFDEAIKWQRKAVEAAPPDEKADYAANVQIYERRQPLRLPLTVPPSTPQKTAPSTAP